MRQETTNALTVLLLVCTACLFFKAFSDQAIRSLERPSASNRQGSVEFHCLARPVTKSNIP